MIRYFLERGLLVRKEEEDFRSQRVSATWKPEVTSHHCDYTHSMWPALASRLPMEICLSMLPFLTTSKETPVKVPLDCLHFHIRAISPSRGAPPSRSGLVGCLGHHVAAAPCGISRRGLEG